VVPMLAGELRRRSSASAAPRRVIREVWAVTPRLFAVGAKGDLMGNVGIAVADGLRGLSAGLLG